MGRKTVIGVVVVVVVLTGIFLGAERIHENGEISDTRMGNLTLTSSAFLNDGIIPSHYTCDGKNVNPPLSIDGVPPNTQSLVLIMDDPDALKPAGKVWDHWIVWNLSVLTTVIKEGEEPKGVHGIGSGGSILYRGPCPPDAEHRYFFKLYALNTMLTLPEKATKQEVERGMEGHILDEAVLIGRYQRL